MENMELVLTLVALIAIPLWVFRHDIIAARRGITYLEYLQQRLDKLNQEYVAGEIKRASLLYPRPATFRHRAKAAAAACVFWLGIILIGVLLYHSHKWADFLLSAGVGGALGNSARMALFCRKAIQSAQLEQSES